MARYFVSVVLILAGGLVLAQEKTQTVTLYSASKYQDATRSMIDFASGTRGGPTNETDVDTWHLGYGFLSISNDDYLQADVDRPEQRNKLIDLGKFNWTDSFRVPVIEPLPALRPGETRQITVNASGRNGADGASGRPGNKHYGSPKTPSHLPVDTGGSETRDDWEKTNGVFAKAIVGHMYLVRVKDDQSDLYVLARIDDLVQGDHCTISWKIVPAPSK
jgi:hypothetical protein